MVDKRIFTKQYWVMKWDSVFCLYIPVATQKVHLKLNICIIALTYLHFSLAYVFLVHFAREGQLIWKYFNAVNSTFFSGYSQCFVIDMCKFDWLLLPIHELAITKRNIWKNSIDSRIQSQTWVRKRTPRTVATICDSSIHCCWSKLNIVMYFNAFQKS